MNADPRLHCPPDADAQGWLAGELDDRARAAFEDHLARCGICRGVVRLLRSESASDRARPEDAFGPTFGRFHLVHRLGAGAFGTVWFAHDPTIDRKVALKILATDAAHDDAAKREAQALGRVVHPNLVTVFEVGEAESHPYIAMEWVAGVDLRRWLRPERSWRDVLEVLVDAGRGLAALHGAGVLHRDVKPANLIVDEAGHVRVVDLGLASFAPMHSIDEAHATNTDETVPPAGSPAYMAPELWHGDGAHEGSDQFSWCVTIFESLYGVRPFVGDTGAELLEAMDRGHVAVHRGQRHVPGWLRAAIVRGLHPDPKARWPSVSALVAALERGLGRRRRAWTIALAAGVVAIAFGAAAGPLLREREAARCRRLGDEVATVWNDAAARELAATLQAVAVSHAEQTSSRVSSQLDDHARAWRAARVEVCEATWLDGRVSREVMRKRVACLDRNLTDLRAAIDVLAAADATTLDRADRISAELREPVDCIDRIDASSPVETAAEDAPIVAELAHAGALRAAGHAEEASERLASVRLSPELSTRPLLHARVLLEIARCDEVLGRYGPGKDALDEALGLALAGRDWALVQDIALLATALVGRRLEQPDAGLAYAEIARGLLPSSGALQARGALEHNVGLVLSSAERFDEAVLAYRRAVDHAVTKYGPRHPEVATSRDSLGVALRESGDVHGAIDEHRLALDIREETLGKHHRDLVHSHDNLAIALAQVGALAEAESHVLTAIEIETRYAERSPDLAALHTELGIVRAKLGRSDAALTAFRRATDMTSEIFGPRHVRTGETRLNLALLHRQIGDLEHAREDVDEVLSILVEGRGERHLSVARARGLRAGILTDLGDLESALAEDRLVLDIKREVLGDDHVDVASARTNLADTLVALERWPEAIALLELAVPVLESSGAAAPSRANASFQLARALRGAGEDPARAESLAQAAREALAHAEGDHAEHLAEIDAWLADVSAP
jgi:tetratricopeptide (TPR) repeat protein